MEIPHTKQTRRALLRQLLLTAFTQGRQIYSLFIDDIRIQNLGVQVLYIAAAVVFLQITSGAVLSPKKLPASTLAQTGII